MHFFTFIYYYSQWLRRRFTPAGLFVLGITPITAIVGFDTTQSMAYQIFTLLAALLLLAMLGSLRFKFSADVQRHLPRFATVGESFNYTLTIHNLGHKKQNGILLRDELEHPLPTREELRFFKISSSEKINRFDRKVGYPRWLNLVQQKRGANIDEVSLSDLQGRGAVQTTVRLTPLRRGTLRFKHVQIGRTDPLGLMRTFMSCPCPGTLLVLPKRYPIPNFSLAGLRKHQRGGVILSSKVGDSEEFSSLRDYRPGDAIRRIHWKSWAKTGKPVVKEYQDEFFVRHALVLDTFSGANDLELFEDAVSVAASMIYTVHDQDSLLDLVFVEDQSYCLTSGRHVVQVERMLQMLGSVRACQDKPFSQLTQFVTRRSHGMSGCICVLLSWDEHRQNLVAHLRALGVPLIILLISHPNSPTPDPGPMRDDLRNFHVLESGKIGEGLASL